MSKKTIVLPGGDAYRVPEEVWDRISALEMKNHDLRLENNGMHREICNKIHELNVERAYSKKLKEMYDELVPFIKEMDFEPAFSNHCEDCKYCAKTEKGVILGCIKNNVCNDFEKENK